MGSFAGAIMGYLVEHAKANNYILPKVILVEPHNAACWTKHFHLLKEFYDN